MAISPTEYSGDIPDHLEADIDAALLEALAELSIEPLATGELGCRALGCTIRKAKAAGLAHVIVVSIAADERDFDIVVEARAVADGRVEFKNQELCDLCGHHELLAVVAAQVRAVAAMVERGDGPPMLLVRGSPRAAQVMLDARALGEAPLEVEVEVGPHRVELRAPGYASQTYRWQARAGIEEVIDYQLSAPRESGRGAKIGGWVSFALGVAGLGIGATLLAIDGREHGPTCTPELRDVRGACPNVYTTGVAGIVSAGVGGAALITGVGLVIYGSRKSSHGGAREPRRQQPVVELAPRAGGVLVRF